MNATWTLSFDGGSLGNPGPAAGGAVLEKADGSVARASRFLEHATNNQAEYVGLLCGLALAREQGATHLRVRGDSQLVVKQVTGEWQVKDLALREMNAEAKGLIATFAAVELGWVPREENTEADAEVRRCLAEHVPNIASTADSFQDLAKLRVGGQDKFSRMKREKLLELLGDGAEAAVAVITAALAGERDGREKLELTALRWVARGLEPARAAQKVLVDLEVGRLAAKRFRG